MTTTLKPFGKVSFEQLIQELHRIFDSDRVNVDEVKELLASYHSNREDWAKFAVFDEHRYTRNLVDEGNGKFNLMILCWGEGMGSSIHDHASAHCFVKMLDGQLVETMFDWPSEDDPPDSPMHEKGEKHKCSIDDVTYINDSMGLHRMENPSHTDKSVSLHLYSPPYSKCATFDERTGHRQICKVTFWSKYGERVKCATQNPLGQKCEPVDSIESLK